MSVSTIQVTFGAPVDLTRDQEGRLHDLIGEICEGYEATHPDRIMWVAGYGGLPMNIHDDDKLDFDMSVLSLDCAERERYDTDRRRKPASPHPIARAGLDVGREDVAIAALAAWRALPEDERNGERPFIHGFNAGWDEALAQMHECANDTSVPRPDAEARAEELLGGNPHTWSHRIVCAVKAKLEPIKNRDLATRMGVSEARISQILNDCPNWTIGTVERLLMAADAVSQEKER